MPVRQPLDMKCELLEAFDHSGRVTEYLVSVVPPQLWHVKPPGGEGRSMAATVAHLQSVRRMFAKMGNAQPVPPGLDRGHGTPKEALRALRQSREALAGLFGQSLARGEARVKGMARRTVNIMLYLIQHDAHHRGQICALTRTLGYRLTRDDVMRIWGWKKLPED